MALGSSLSNTHCGFTLKLLGYITLCELRIPNRCTNMKSQIFRAPISNEEKIARKSCDNSNIMITANY